MASSNPSNPSITFTLPSASGVKEIDDFSEDVTGTENCLKKDLANVETVIERIADMPPEALKNLMDHFDKASQRAENLLKFAADAVLKLASGRRALEQQMRKEVPMRETPGRDCGRLHGLGVSSSNADSGVGLVSGDSQILSETNSCHVASPTDSAEPYQSTSMSKELEHVDKESDLGVKPDTGTVSDNVKFT